MSDQHLASSPGAAYTHKHRRAATVWHRTAATMILGLGILLGLGSLWWLAFWLTARMATDVQFTGISLSEYQVAISMMMIMGVVGLLIPAILVIALGLYLRRRWS